MALIKCEDCGKEFSDKASACPNCGCPNEIKTESKLLFKTDWKGMTRTGKLEAYSDKVIITTDPNALYMGQNGKHTYFYKDLVGISFRKAGGFIKGCIVFDSANSQIDDVFYINFRKEENSKFEEYYNKMMECFNKEKK